MADGKLLKCYMKIESYNKRLALVQEYQHQYFSTTEQYVDLNRHQDAAQGLLYFIFKTMCLESQHLNYTQKHTKEHTQIENL
jgi:hypothetical protein